MGGLLPILFRPRILHNLYLRWPVFPTSLSLVLPCFRLLARPFWTGLDFSPLLELSSYPYTHTIPYHTIPYHTIPYHPYPYTHTHIPIPIYPYPYTHTHIPIPIYP